MSGLGQGLIHPLGELDAKNATVDSLGCHVLYWISQQNYGKMMKKLNLALIRIDGDTQAREALSQDKVAEYAELMKDGSVFPPIEVFFDGSDYWLADGFHRYFATQTNGSVSIEANIHNGTLDDAQLYAFGANKGRGLEMSPKDIRSVVLRMLKHPIWGKWVNAEIARHVGCSKMTVGRVKSTMQEPEAETKKTYRNKNGKEQTINTKNIGRKKETEEDDGKEQKVVELTDTVNELSTENQALRDKIAIGQWDASEIEKIDVQDTVAELREQIRVLEIDNKALRESRDMYQNRNAELMKTVKALQNKLK